jgi:hypothetical protein
VAGHAHQRAGSVVPLQGHRRAHEPRGGWKNTKKHWQDIRASSGIAQEDSYDSFCGEAVPKGWCAPTLSLPRQNLASCREDSCWVLPDDLIRALAVCDRQLDLDSELYLGE